MVDHANGRVVGGALQALAQGEIPRFLEELTDDVVWHVGGRNAASGVYQGRDEVLRSFRVLQGMLGGPPRVTPHDLLATDDHVVVLNNLVAQRRGATYEGNSAFIFHVRGGKISECWVVQEDQYAWDDFCSL